MAQRSSAFSPHGPLQQSFDAGIAITPSTNLTGTTNTNTIGTTSDIPAVASEAAHMPPSQPEPPAKRATATIRPQSQSSASPSAASPSAARMRVSHVQPTRAAAPTASRIQAGDGISRKRRICHVCLDGVSKAKAYLICISCNLVVSGACSAYRCSSLANHRLLACRRSRRCSGHFKTGSSTMLHAPGLHLGSFEHS
ncbi:uncharacterized protein MONBRDRAFT_11478 [Monosiga brevicollis MX1]|uniref:Uncharacterized protein n=1 Tax=Monosiga brevicollis TaxID=81824 RepID=A9V996_MONBE|nr:uncharacterized protein MONBRDRAFT_11478 [Monosiga brevicollis MX1]EDQ85823.1 predicted protein [Monosiga brevicollis MX1]|eukprot:XP_001749302.1 hypothetical protein [Monosiga brevicollis MX1]